jgi:hypothetical protein
MRDHIITVYESLPNTIAVWDNGKLLTLTAHAEAMPEDAIQEYGTGLVITLNGGVGWNADGLVQAPTQHKVHGDNFEYLSTGTISGQVLVGDSGDGIDWADDGWIQ